MNIKWLSVITASLLLLAIPSGLWPYGYYILLRWIVSISAGILIYKYYEQKIQSWMILFGIVAILFNPIAPIYLDKGIWVVIDFIVALLFLFSFLISKGEKYERTDEIKN